MLVARPSVSSSLKVINCSFRYASHTMESVESASFFVPSTSFCSLSSWFTSSYTHHSPHLRSHYQLSLPRPFTPDLKLICFTNPFIVFLVRFGLPSRILDLDRTKRTLAFVWVSSSYIYFFVFDGLSWSQSAFQSTLNSCIVSYEQSERKRMHFSFLMSDSITALRFSAF